MECFDAAELAFAQTFFPPTQRTVCVRSDVPTASLTSADVPPSAGAFSFEASPGLHNRFIVWRADGPNLLLNEYSAERDLQVS